MCACVQIAAAAAACISADDFVHLHASAARRSAALHVTTTGEPLSLLSPLKTYTLHRHVSRSAMMHAGDAHGQLQQGGSFMVPPGSPGATQGPPGLQLSAHLAMQISMHLRVHKALFTLLDEEVVHLRNDREGSGSRRFREATVATGVAQERHESGPAATYVRRYNVYSRMVYNVSCSAFCMYHMAMFHETIQRHSAV
jgi:hypothetical protein